MTGAAHTGLCVMLPGTVAKYFTTCNPEHNITWKIHPEIGYKVGRSSLLRILLYYFTGKNLTRAFCITHSTSLQKENVRYNNTIYL